MRNSGGERRGSPADTELEPCRWGFSPRLEGGSTNRETLREGPKSASVEGGALHQDLISTSVPRVTSPQGAEGGGPGPAGPEASSDLRSAIVRSRTTWAPGDP